MNCFLRFWSFLIKKTAVLKKLPNLHHTRGSHSTTGFVTGDDVPAGRGHGDGVLVRHVLCDLKPFPSGDEAGTARGAYKRYIYFCYKVWGGIVLTNAS